MPESRSCNVPRGTLRALRREALALRHLSDADARARLLTLGPAHLVELALERRSVVLAGGFLQREPGAAFFEQRAHAEHHGIELAKRGAA